MATYSEISKSRPKKDEIQLVLAHFRHPPSFSEKELLDAVESAASVPPFAIRPHPKGAILGLRSPEDLKKAVGKTIKVKDVPIPLTPFPELSVPVADRGRRWRISGVPFGIYEPDIQEALEKANPAIQITCIKMETVRGRPSTLTAFASFWVKDPTITPTLKSLDGQPVVTFDPEKKKKAASPTPAPPAQNTAPAAQTTAPAAQTTAPAAQPATFDEKVVKEVVRRDAVAAAKEVAARPAAAEASTFGLKETDAEAQCVEPLTPTHQVQKPADQLVEGRTKTAKKRKIEELSPLSPASPALPQPPAPEDPLEREAPEVTKSFFRRVGLSLPERHAALMIYEDADDTMDIEIIDEDLGNEFNYATEEIRELHRSDDEDSQRLVDFYVLRQMATNNEEDAVTLAKLYNSYAVEITNQYFVRQNWVQRVSHNGVIILVLFQTRIFNHIRNIIRVDLSLKD